MGSRMAKKFAKKYDSLTEKNGHDVKTGRDYVDVILTKGDERYESRVYIEAPDE